MGEIADRAAVIAARRQHIRDTARCRTCGTTAKACHADALSVPEARCCTMHCNHREDPRALNALLDEVAAGGPIRTVAEIDPPPVLGPHRPSWSWLLEQDTWWYPQGRPAVRVVHMDKPWRLNVIRFIERRAPQLASDEYWRMASWAAGPMGPGGDMAVDAFDSAMVEVISNPLGWVREQPLMIALRKGLPKPGGRAEELLAARAVHWNTCPMRRAHPGKLDRCVCIRDGDRVVGATNDPAPARSRPAREACVPEWTS